MCYKKDSLCKTSETIDIIIDAEVVVQCRVSDTKSMRCTTERKLKFQELYSVPFDGFKYLIYRLAAGIAGFCQCQAYPRSEEQACLVETNFLLIFANSVHKSCPSTVLLFSTVVRNCSNQDNWTFFGNSTFCQKSTFSSIVVEHETLMTRPNSLLLHLLMKINSQDYMKHRDKNYDSTVVIEHNVIYYVLHKARKY